jgi:hypothetical protein
MRDPIPERRMPLGCDEPLRREDREMLHELVRRQAEHGDELLERHAAADQRDDASRRQRVVVKTCEPRGDHVAERMRRSALVGIHEPDEASRRHERTLGAPRLQSLRNEQRVPERARVQRIGQRRQDLAAELAGCDGRDRTSVQTSDLDVIDPQVRRGRRER